MISKEDALELLKLAKVNVTINKDTFRVEYSESPYSDEYPLSYLNNDILIVSIIRKEAKSTSYNTGYKNGKASLKSLLVELLSSIEMDEERENCCSTN